MGLNDIFSARKVVTGFFEGKRKALNISEGDDFEKGIKRDFLGRMNSISRDMEADAIDWGEKKEGEAAILSRASAAFEKLKKDFVRGRKGDDPVLKPYQGVLEKIEKL
jgi:hypothetical protein